MLKSVILPLSLLLPGAAGAVPTEWGGNGHFYELFTDELSAEEARAEASSMTFNGLTGHLVTITSQAESDFISSTFSGANIWIGLSDAGTEGEWIWDTGPEAGTLASSVFEAWAPGEPNDLGGEDYAVTNWGSPGVWNDLSGFFTFDYIVEYSAVDGPSPVPIPASAALLTLALGGLLLLRRF